MPHAKESYLVTSCLKYLQLLENQGKIIWVDRMNSGAIRFNNRFIRLHRSGTPDIIVINRNGHVVWIECKVNNNVQTIDQKEFESRVKNLYSHKYLIIKDISDLERELHG